MGICLYMSTELDKKIPFWFRSDSKAFVWYITEVEAGAGAFPNTIGELAEHFDISIRPLLKIGGEDLSMEELGNNEELFLSLQEANQAAWQDPQELIDCIKVFISKLEAEPNVFTQLGVKDFYFLGGTFKSDLTDILRMAEWAKENEAGRVRLEAM